MTNPTEKHAPQFDASTRLAYLRTQLALERTMMSWIRTATSLITFGFAVYKFFEFEQKASEQAKHVISPRVFGLIMIVMGLLSLLMGTVQHVVGMRQIRAAWPESPRSVAAVVAALIAVLGLAATFAAIFRE
jgi:putative membrane protein